jgi:hypothetical protein
MSFDMGGAASGAATGAKLGTLVPGVGNVIGGVAGGLLGGFFGGGGEEAQFEPEYYTASMYHSDMAPYKAMIDQQQKLGGDLMNQNSMINQMQRRQTMGDSMDQMAMSNIVNQRNNAMMGGGMANSGLMQQQQMQNMAQFGNQGLLAANKQFQQMFNQGIGVQQKAMDHQGDYSTGLAELNAGNIATANKFAMHQAGVADTGMGDILGAGMGFLESDMGKEFLGSKYVQSAGGGVEKIASSLADFF